MNNLDLICAAISKAHTTTTYANATLGEAYSDFEWVDNAITEEQFNTVLSSVATNAYSRQRQAAYAALNQFEMQFDDAANSTTTWVDAIAAIKQEFPK